MRASISPEWICPQVNAFPGQHRQSPLGACNLPLSQARTAASGSRLMIVKRMRTDPMGSEQFTWPYGPFLQVACNRTGLQ